MYTYKNAYLRRGDIPAINDTRYILNTTVISLGIAVAQWLRCCAINRKVAVSIPAGVGGIFHWHKILPIAL